MWGFRDTLVYMTMSILVFSCANVLSFAVIKNAHNTSLASGDPISTQEEERLDIAYQTDVFKEIEPDVLQVFEPRNLDKVVLTCKSTTRSSVNATWVYHGINTDEQVGLKKHKNLVWLTLFNSSSPVARMECFDRDNPALSNNTLIYRGDGKPPFLHNHGKTIPSIVLNDTTAQLPCVLNYPLDNTNQYQLQLFKDGVQVENKDNCLNYTPEHGYSLNLTKLTNRYGTYECRVINSTHEDFVKVELGYDDLIRAKINVKHSSGVTTFYEGEPYDRTFICQVPITDFKNKFEWYFLYANGSYVKLTPESNLTAIAHPELYTDLVKLKFANRLVTHVVCAAFLQGNDTQYNNTYAVEIKEPIKPIITTGRSTGPIIYTSGKNLTCSAYGDPITFNWLKDGKPVSGLNMENSFITPNKKSTISLNPSADDKDSNYTCEVNNFLGNASISFRVQLKEPEAGNSSNKTLVTLGICLAAITVFILLLLAFYQIKFERRFSDEQIRNFFHGIGSREVPYNEFGEQEPYENVKYDTSKEIKIQSLNFVRDLKGGNFGKVQFGYWLKTDTGESLPVAIKSIKDDPKASHADIDFAFRNFLKEIKIMQILGEHPNVVKYIGAVTSDLSQYSAYLVVEYCCEGDLATYLRDLKKHGGSFYDDVEGLHQTVPNGSGYNDVQGLHVNGSNGSMNGVVLKTSHLMTWAEHIAHGMQYISSKNLVHRDIAARNVLLSYEGPHSNHPDPGKLVAKISDFGLSKNLQEFPKDYYPIITTETNRSRPISLPLRWISVETLENLKFSSQSDVWAFGVTLWELFSLGDYPYRHLVDREDLRSTLISYLRQDGRLGEPDFVPSEIWDVMQECWQEIPAQRPDFISLSERLHAINENRRNLQIQHEPEGNEVQPPVNFAGYSTVDFVENLGYNPSSDLDYDEDSQSDGESRQ